MSYYHFYHTYPKHQQQQQQQQQQPIQYINYVYAPPFVMLPQPVTIINLNQNPNDYIDPKEEEKRLRKQNKHNRPVYTPVNMNQYVKNCRTRARGEDLHNHVPVETLILNVNLRTPDTDERKTAAHSSSEKHEENEHEEVEEEERQRRNKPEIQLIYQSYEPKERKNGWQRSETCDEIQLDIDQVNSVINDPDQDGSGHKNTNHNDDLDID